MMHSSTRFKSTWFKIPGITFSTARDLGTNTTSILWRVVTNTAQLRTAFTATVHQFMVFFLVSEPCARHVFWRIECNTASNFRVTDSDSRGCWSGCRLNGKVAAATGTSRDQKFKDFQQTDRWTSWRNGKTLTLYSGEALLESRASQWLPWPCLRFLQDLKAPRTDNGNGLSNLSNPWSLATARFNLILLSSGLSHGVFKPAACRFTDWAITALWHTGASTKLGLMSPRLGTPHRTSIDLTHEVVVTRHCLAPSVTAKWPQCDTSALHRGGWLAPRPGRFTPGNHRTGSWMGPRAGLDVVKNGKIIPLPEFEPQAVQPED
jgi:hypothetical protein